MLCVCVCVCELGSSPALRPPMVVILMWYDTFLGMVASRIQCLKLLAMIDPKNMIRVKARAQILCVCVCVWHPSFEAPNSSDPDVVRHFF